VDCWLVSGGVRTFSGRFLFVVERLLGGVMANAVHSIRVIDGDTVEAMVSGTEFFRNDYKLLSIRIFGVDTPELETFEGMLVRQVVIQVLSSYKEPTVLYRATDKYAGRGVGDIADGPNETFPSLSKFLLSNVLAKPYKGGRKLTWSEADLRELVKRCTSFLSTAAIDQLSRDYTRKAQAITEKGTKQEQDRTGLIYCGAGSLKYVQAVFFN
jgi:hypothetical protein